MTAATLRAVLQAAVRDRYAVAGLVVLGWEDAVAYVRAAEETNIPIVLQAGPGCRRHTPIAVLGKMFRHLADNASVPIVCHVDHAYTIEECREGIDSGFTSVMFDGSKLPIEANVETTARIVEMAKRADVSVEGEVGIVGYSGGVASASTIPEEAAKFDRESGADALAISVGNIHLQSEARTTIDFSALRAIEAVTSLPLVLHGGSGIPASVRQTLARQTRVSKFNIGTELRMTFGFALRRYLTDNPNEFDRLTILKAPVPSMQAVTAAIIRDLRHSSVELQIPPSEEKSKGALSGQSLPFRD